MKPVAIHYYSAVLTLLTSTAAAGGCANETQQTEGARGPSSSALESVPSPEQPGHGQLSEVFVGTDQSGRFALATAVDGAGRRIAYACDGEKSSAWFSADTLDDALGSASPQVGEPMELRFDPRGLSTDAPPFLHAVLSTTGGELTFELERALPMAGPYRFSEQDSLGEFQAGWVLLNDGRIFGLDSGGGAVKSREITGENGEDDSIAVGGSTPGSSAETDEYILNRFRCGRLVLRILRFSAAFPNARPATSPFYIDAQKQFDALTCAEHGFVFPVVELDSAR